MTRRRVTAALAPLAALAALLSSGCATRGTIAELGRPEFSGTVPAQVELTLVEPRTPGSFNAYPRGAGDGDYHCQVRMEEPPHKVGEKGELIAFRMRATPTGNKRLKTFEVIAWPLLAKHIVRFKEDGHPPGSPEPLKRVAVDKPIPDSEAFGVIVSFPADKLAGFDHVGVSALLVFEDGWVSIVDSAVLVP